MNDRIHFRMNSAGKLGYDANSTHSICNINYFSSKSTNEISANIYC